MWYLVVLVLLSTAIASPISKSNDTDSSNEVDQSPLDPMSYTGMIKEYCLVYSNIEAFDNITRTETEAVSCAQKVIQELQQQHANADPAPSMSEKLKVYCRKSPDVVNCFDGFTKSFDVCQRPDERGMFKNAIEVFFNYACYQGGEHIVSFVSDGGSECIQSKTSEIEACTNETFSKYLPLKIPVDKTALRTAEEIESECRDVFVLKKCVLSQLKTCEKATTANLAEELINSLIKVTPCEKYDPSKVTPTEKPNTT